MISEPIIRLRQEPEQLHQIPRPSSTRYKIKIVSPSQPDEILFQPRTELGRRLWEIRTRSIASGERLMGLEEIAREIKERRGERDDQGV